MPFGTFARAARQLDDPSQARSGPPPEDIYEKGEMGIGPPTPTPRARTGANSRTQTHGERHKLTRETQRFRSCPHPKPRPTVTPAACSKGTLQLIKAQQQGEDLGLRLLCP